MKKQCAIMWSLMGMAIWACASPPFSWDRVPMYAHLGKSEGDFTDAELDFMATHFDFLTIEKGQAVRTRSSTEAGIYTAARELKRRNPRCHVLFYWNAFLDYPLYASSRTLSAAWHLADREGRPLLKEGRVPYFDLSLPAMRDWWAGVAVDAMCAAPLDGIFADALPQVLSPARARVLGVEKHQALVRGAKELLAMTGKRLGAHRTVLVNGTRADEYRELLDWDFVSGVMIEHFGHFTSDTPEAMRADLNTMEWAGKRGKVVVLKGWPGFSWLDKEMLAARPRSELLRLARERITFPLACFLVVAQPHSYFCYTWGYRHDQGALESYPELDRPLGPPQGDAVWRGLTATRTFQHASVTVDLVAKTARIEWQP